ncbi:MAG: NlpC/P60 family protein [Pseudomonadota bacterium]
MNDTQRPVTRANIVASARGWLGTPYHHQASRRGVGVDCLGLIRGVWRETYSTEAEVPPAYTRDWAEARGEDTLLDAAGRHMTRRTDDAREAGDVVIFRYRAGVPAKHVGILTGPRHFIHAMEGVPVSEVALCNWWQRRIAGVFTFPGVES